MESRFWPYILMLLVAFTVVLMQPFLVVRAELPAPPVYYWHEHLRYSSLHRAWLPATGRNQ